MIACRPAGAPATPTSPTSPAPLPAPVSEDGCEPLPPPEPGDWLASFHEDGQTFDQYVRDCANRRSSTRTTLYLQPMGEHDERYRKAVADLRDYCEIFFGVPCKLLDPIPLPDHCLIMPRRQYNATMLIGQLEERLPKDALALAGVANRDLFSKGLNFVFGEGSLRNRCGVYSLFRYEREPDRFLWRAGQTLTHELGHILGIQHCIRWKCVMCGANSLVESDRHPLHLCPEDLRKVQWNTGCDPRERYRRLAAYYDAHAMPTEAAWCRARLK